MKLLATLIIAGMIFGLVYLSPDRNATKATIYATLAAVIVFP